MLQECKDTVKFVARIDDEYAAKLMECHSAVNRSLFPKGENWYDIVIDSSYSSKKEVFAILYHCYLFVLKRYYKFIDGEFVAEDVAANLDTKEVVKAVKSKDHTVNVDIITTI